ncbi:hypothetical protein Tco_0054073 [Tanacetum coccineum]
MENSLDHLENYPEQLENSPDHVENSSEQMENYPDYVENSSVHVENSHVHVENFLDLSGDPFSLEKFILESGKKRTNVEQMASGSDPLFPPTLVNPINSNQSRNEVVKNVAHEGIFFFGTIESVPKNMSPGGSKHDHIDSLN